MTSGKWGVVGIGLFRGWAYISKHATTNAVSAAVYSTQERGEGGGRDLEIIIIMPLFSPVFPSPRLYLYSLGKGKEGP